MVEILRLIITDENTDRNDKYDNNNKDIPNATTTTTITINTSMITTENEWWRTWC